MEVLIVVALLAILFVKGRLFLYISVPLLAIVFYAIAGIAGAGFVLLVGFLLLKMVS